MIPRCSFSLPGGGADFAVVDLVEVGPQNYGLGNASQKVQARGAKRYSE